MKISQQVWVIENLSYCGCGWGEVGLQFIHARGRHVEVSKAGSGLTIYVFLWSFYVLCAK